MAMQTTLEDKVMKKMDDLAAQIQNAGSAKDTVAKVAEEFRTFRELMFSMLGLLRQQISNCAQHIDNIETRHRRKALILLGVPEVQKEDCRERVLDILNSKLCLKSITASSIKICHRLGTPTKERHRPILIRFSDLDAKSSVWKAKKGLKGSSITVREFLTKARQDIFARARLHFGMRAVWSLDGIISVKVQDGSRHKICSMAELSSLTSKYPKIQGASSGKSEKEAVSVVDSKLSK